MKLRKTFDETQENFLMKLRKTFDETQENRKQEASF